MSKQDDNVPLGVKCESGRLVIEIGIRTLAYAVAAAPWAAPFDEAADDYIRTFAITDPDRFAAEVRLALLAEDEGGETLVADMIDCAAKSAINDGCDGIDEASHAIKHGQFAPCETWASAAEAPHA